MPRCGPRREADGMIFLGHRLAPTMVALVAKQGEKAPIVNGCEFEPGLNVSSVHIANAVAAAEAMQHLYDLGHQRIGVTGHAAEPDQPRPVERRSGRRGGAAPWDEVLVRTGDFSVDSGEALTHELMAEAAPPTAIFCFSDEMAIGAIAALRERGLDCPRDVSVVGFDDIRYARAFHPALTTISQPKETIGRKAVEMLLAILSKKAEGLASITLPHELVVRERTAPPPAR